MMTEVNMFNDLKQINSRPSPFQFYTADEGKADFITKKDRKEALKW